MFGTLFSYILRESRALYFITSQAKEYPLNLSIKLRKAYCLVRRAYAILLNNEMDFLKLTFINNFCLLINLICRWLWKHFRIISWGIYRLLLCNKMAASTSFSKRVKANIRQIPGTKPSLYNNQLLVSTGIPSLDAVLGKCIWVNVNNSTCARSLATETERRRRRRKPTGYSDVYVPLLWCPRWL